MIDEKSLVFVPDAPDLQDQALKTLLRHAAGTGVWIRWSALLFALAATLGPAGLYAFIFLDGTAGSLTAAGHMFFAVIATLGLVGLRFSGRLFRDANALRAAAARLTEYTLLQGEATGFGPWLTAGGAYNRWQRVRWQLAGGRSGESAYVKLTLAIWLRIGDPVWIATDPAGRGRPVFLGARRAAPEILSRPGAGLAETYRELASHLEEGGDTRKEKIMKIWGVGKPS